jgi:hypothetical protein
MIKTLHHSLAFATAALCVATFAGCAAAPRLAQNKNVDVAGQKLELAGAYRTRSQDLSITFNGDAALNGRFPPYTPTLNLNTKYRDLDVRAECYFASILGNRRGVMGIVATAVQSSHGKTSDSCAISVGGSVVETLYFH